MFLAPKIFEFARPCIIVANYSSEGGICNGKIRSVLEIVFELNDTEIRCLAHLCKSGKLRVRNLSEILNKDRSTVQRALNALNDRKLVEREAKCCEGPKRGRYFLYSPASMIDIRKRLTERLECWYEEHLEAINSADQIFES